MQTDASDKDTELELLVVVAQTSPSGEKSVLRKGVEATATLPIRADRLAENIGQVCRYVGRIFENATTTVQDLELDSLEVHVELTAGGEVRLIGAITTEVKGGLALTFKRPRADR